MWMFDACSMVITAPVVGKLSRQSLEQIIGTLVGGIFGYLTWLVIDAYHINKDGFMLSLCLSLCSAAMGFFNVVVEESLSDANMTALTFLSVVFGTTESPTGARYYHKLANIELVHGTLTSRVSSCTQAASPKKLLADLQSSCCLQSQGWQASLVVYSCLCYCLFSCGQKALVSKQCGTPT